MIKETKQKDPAGVSDNTAKISTDPFGSYTGRSENPFERPVQDADDL